jgi:hypothetical protein
MERILNHFERAGIRLKPSYISKLEAQTDRLIANLTPGKEEKLFENEENNLRIYHIGQETRVIPGIYPKIVGTGKEYVFIECRMDEKSYHLVGNVDTAGKFSFVKMTRYDKGEYRRIFLKKEIILNATQILRCTNPE